jgi:hypothetical protein
MSSGRCYIDEFRICSSDLERELSDKHAGVQLLEREVTDGRRRCTELEEELDLVNKEIGDVRVSQRRVAFVNV